MSGQSVLDKQTKNSRHMSSEWENEKVKHRSSKKSRRDRLNQHEHFAKTGSASHNINNTNSSTNPHNRGHNSNELDQSKSSLTDNRMPSTRGPDSTGRHSPSKPKPLQISKTTRNQFQVTDFQQPPQTTHPPRISSISKQLHNETEIYRGMHAKVPAVVDVPNSAVSNYPAVFNTFGIETSLGTTETLQQPTDNYYPDTCIVPATEHDPYKIVSTSETSETSGILGDFIPIAPPYMTPGTVERGRTQFEPMSRERARLAVKVKVNPYEFEPDSPYVAPYDARQTRIGDFMDISNEAPKRTPLNQIPRSPHMKNSHSTGNAYSIARKATPIGIPLQAPSRPVAHTIHRSESSPNLMAQPFPQQAEQSEMSKITPNTDRYSPYGYSHSPTYSTRLEPLQDRMCSDPARNDPLLRDAMQDDPYLRHTIRDDSFGSDHHDMEYNRESTSRASVRYRNSEHGQSATSQSPHSPTHTSRAPRQDHPMGPYSPSRHLTRSPTKTLDNVPERDERDSIVFREYLPPTPKKRSRSPMKKMFGEGGWLGSTPDEKHGTNLRSAKSRQGEHKKPSMMGRLKNKFEDFAEKADLTPTKSARNSCEKPAKLSVLSVSLTPPQQARIFMEVELMLVHTANTFLMTQFSQGRIAVDTIKKIVDTWKGKGRAIVIEFMYDQATQRDLVSANQENFRFYGGTAGNEIRINSMLYNWKQVASIMAIRTFCYADTIIMKLLFDVEQILELLGGAENVMLRFQQIRGTTNELIRIARHKKNLKNSHRSHDGEWSVHSSAAGSSTLADALDDPYGGLKLVPDSYVE